MLEDSLGDVQLQPVLAATGELALFLCPVLAATGQLALVPVLCSKEAVFLLEGQAPTTREVCCPCQRHIRALVRLQRDHDDGPVF